MARPRNPEADPVRIVRGGRAVKYYESGWVDGGKRPEVSCKLGEAEALADRIRAELYAKREKETGVVAVAGPHPNATIEDSYEAWIAELEGDDTIPEGTTRKYRGNARKWLGLVGGNLCSEMDETLWKYVLDAVIAKRRMPNTLDGINTTMSAWRKWARSAKWIPARCLSDSEALTAIYNDADRRLKKKLADQSAAIITKKADPDGDDDRKLRLEDVPTGLHIVRLSESIYERETTRAPWSPTSGPGSKGGAQPLGHDDAWRISQSVVAQSAIGARKCELLALHSTQIHADGRIWINRQLDSYKPWIPGEAPPVRAPKGGKSRWTQCWSWYRPELLKLAEYANEHNGGWLFAPTRGQRDWAGSWSDAIDRGIELMNWKVDHGGTGDDADKWLWRPHYTRHHYGSWSLAAQELGGYGWPLLTVSAFLGHGSTSFTEKVYVHRVGDDHAYASQTSQHRPGA